MQTSGHRSASTETVQPCAGNGKVPNGAQGSEAAALLSEDANTEEDSGQQTMVRVICSQRDRLKERVNQLGDELSKVSVTLWRAIWAKEHSRGWLAAPAVIHAMP